MDERAEAILKIALCRKYQDTYSDIDTLCGYCGLYEDDIKAVKRWKYHSIAADPLILTVLLDYIQENEKERFDKSVYLYNKNNK
jgi:hypothetical protein